MEEFAQLDSGFAGTALTATFLVVILLLFVGNVLLSVAVWRSGTLPRWAGAIWAASALLLYPLGLVIGLTITGNSPLTEPLGGLLIAISGGVDSVEGYAPASTRVGAKAQARVQ